MQAFPTKPDERKNIMKKLLATLLALSAAVSLLVVPVGAGTDQPDHFLPGRAYYKTDQHLNQERRYIIDEDSIIRIEEGATMYVSGEFDINGKLKNYGTLVIRDVTPSGGKQEAKFLDNYGNVHVNGTLENYGKIVVESASLTCNFTGKIINDGTIELNNCSNDNLTLMRITSYRNSAGGVRRGELYNNKKGVININNTVGKGLVIYKDAKFENKGTLNKADK